MDACIILLIAIKTIAIETKPLNVIRFKFTIADKLMYDQLLNFISLSKHQDVSRM